MKLPGTHVFSLFITQLVFNTKFQEDNQILNNFSKGNDILTSHTIKHIHSTYQ